MVALVSEMCKMLVLVKVSTVQRCHTYWLLMMLVRPLVLFRSDNVDRAAGGERNNPQPSFVGAFIKLCVLLPEPCWLSI